MSEEIINNNTGENIENNTTNEYDLVCIERDYVESGTLRVPRISYATNLKVFGKVEFMYRVFDPTIGAWQETIISHNIDSAILPKQYIESNDNLLHDATVDLSRTSNGIDITIVKSEESNKGYIWQLLPKVTITKVSGVIEQDIIGINYGNKSNNMQIMDIHYPESILSGSSNNAPAIITIHGGAWSHQNNTDKDSYNHMTEIITDLGLIHVNMEYESTSTIGNENNTGGENNGTNNNSDSGTENPYEIMLGNIESVLSFLSQKAEELKLNKNKIGLMGFSAGGHLALLYTFKKIYDNIYDSDYDLPIKLVISEAGPTDFSSMFNNIDSFIEANAVGQITNVLKLCNKGSIQNSDCGYCEASYKDRNSSSDVICPISPLDYANVIGNNSNLPRILLLYGSGTGTLGVDTNDYYKGDGIVPFSNAKMLLEKFYGNDFNQSYQYDSNRKYNLIKLSNIEHSNIPYEAAKNHSNILRSEFNILKNYTSNN